MADEAWKQYTPEQRIKNTVALAHDLETLRKVRRELFLACVGGGRFNTFLKNRGYDPAAFEGLVAGLIAAGVLPEREKVV